MCVHVSVVNYRMVKIQVCFKQMGQCTELAAVRLKNCVKGWMKHQEIEETDKNKNNMHLTSLKVYMNISENAPKVSQVQKICM